ncbi:MAG: hypothetical protein Q3M30_13090 [Candidatus Electrothrix sp. Rat3]|nr:hypothetical protein [Candidatus Electrothrix rattekaaiensis]
MNLSNRVSLRNVLHLRNTIVLLMAGAFLSSCANMPEGDRIRAEGAGIGGLIGAVGGAAACKDNRAACAAGFGAGGGLLGYIVGDSQANQIGQMDRQSNYREDLAYTLQQQHAGIAKYNYQLRGQVDQYERDIRKNIDRRRAVQEELRAAQNECNRLRYVVAEGHKKAARMSDPNQRMTCKKKLEEMKLQISDLNVSIRRLQDISNRYFRAGA